MNDSSVKSAVSTSRASAARPSNRLPFTAFKSRLSSPERIQNKSVPSSNQQLLVNNARKRLGRVDSKTLERRPIGSGAKSKKSGTANNNVKLTSSNNSHVSRPPTHKCSKSPPKHSAKSDDNLLASKALDCGGHSSIPPPVKKRTLPIAIQPPVQGASKEYTAISPAEVVKSVYGKGIVNSNYKIPSKKRRSSGSPLSPTSKHPDETTSGNGQNASNHQNEKTPTIDSAVETQKCMPSLNLHEPQQESDPVEQKSKQVSNETQNKPRKRQFAKKSTGGYKSRCCSLVVHKPLAVGNKQWILKRYSRLRLKKLPFNPIKVKIETPVQVKIEESLQGSSLKVKKEEPSQESSQKAKREDHFQGPLFNVKKEETTALDMPPSRKRTLQPSASKVPSKKPKIDNVSRVAELATSTSKREQTSTCSRTVPFEDVIPLKCARVTPYTPPENGKRMHLLARVNALTKTQSVVSNESAKICNQVPHDVHKSSSKYAVCESSDDTAFMSAAISDSMDDGRLSDFVPSKTLSLDLGSTSFSDLSSDELPRGTGDLETDVPPPSSPANEIIKDSVEMKPQQKSSSSVVTPSVNEPPSSTCTTLTRSSVHESSSHSPDNQTIVSRPPTYTQESLHFHCSSTPPSTSQVCTQLKAINDIVNQVDASVDTNDKKGTSDLEKNVSSLPEATNTCVPNLSSVEPKVTHKASNNIQEPYLKNTKHTQLSLQLKETKTGSSTANSQDTIRSPILSPTDEEYSLRLQETINKFVYGDDAENKSSRSSRAVTPAPCLSVDFESDDEEQDLSLIVRIRRTDVLHFPSPSSPVQYVGLTTETLGTYQSQGVQVDRGMIVDKEIIDQYISVKISEALYEMNEQFQKTEALVEKVMADKEKLEKLLQVKVQMIRDLTVTGFKPVLVDAETMTNDSYLQQQSANVTLGRPKNTKMKNVAVQTNIKGATNNCLKHLNQVELQPYLRMRSATPLSTTSEPDDTEMIDDERVGAQELKKQWMFKDSETCSRCTAIRPQVRLMRALNNSVNSKEDKTVSTQSDLMQQFSGTVIQDTVGWDMLGPTLQKLFEGVHNVYVMLKNLSVETVLKKCALEVVSSLDHLLSHLPLPQSIAQPMQQETQTTRSESTASYLLGWRTKELIILLKEILKSSAVLPAFFRAELIQTQKLVHKTLDFASEGLRNETLLHGSHGYMVDSNHSSLPLRSHELPPLPMEPFIHYNFDDLDVDPYGSESSYSSLTSSDSEVDERPLVMSTPRTSSRREPKKNLTKLKKKPNNPTRVRRHTDPTSPSKITKKKTSKNDIKRPQLSLKQNMFSTEHARKRPPKNTSPKKSRAPSVFSTCARVSPTISKRKAGVPNILHRPASAPTKKAKNSTTSSEVSSVGTNVSSSVSKNPVIQSPITTTPFSSPPPIIKNVSVASVSTSTCTLSTVSHTQSSPRPYHQQLPTVQQAVLNPSVIPAGTSSFSTPLPSSRNIAIHGRLQQNGVPHQQFVSVAQLLQNQSKPVCSSNVLIQSRATALPLKTTSSTGTGRISIHSPGANPNLILALLAKSQNQMQQFRRQVSVSRGVPSILSLSSQPPSNSVKDGTQIAVVSQPGASVAGQVAPLDLPRQSTSLLENIPASRNKTVLAQTTVASLKIPQTTPSTQHEGDTPIRPNVNKDTFTSAKITVYSTTGTSQTSQKRLSTETKPLTVTSTPIVHSKTTTVGQLQVCPSIQHEGDTPIRPNVNKDTITSAKITVSNSGPHNTTGTSKISQTLNKTVSSTETKPIAVTSTPIVHSKTTTVGELLVCPMTTVAIAPSTVSVVTNSNIATSVPTCGSKSEDDLKSVNTDIITSTPMVCAVTTKTSCTVTKSTDVSRAVPPSSSSSMRNKCITPEFVQRLTSALSAISRNSTSTKTFNSNSKPVATSASTALPKKVSTSLSQSQAASDTQVTLTQPSLSSPSMQVPVALSKPCSSSPSSLHPTTTIASTQLPSVSTSAPKPKPDSDSCTTSTKPPPLLEPATTTITTTTAMSVPAKSSTQETTTCTTTFTQTQTVCTALLPKWSNISLQQTSAITTATSMTGTRMTTSTVAATGTPLVCASTSSVVPPSANAIQHNSIQPLIEVSHSNKGLVVKWTFPDKFLNLQYLVQSYELFASSANTINALPVSQWSKVGNIDPLPLPMAVTMTNFTKGCCYRFSVRALFVKGYSSGYSQPCIVNLL